MDGIVGVWSKTVKAKSDIESSASPVEGHLLEMDADWHSFKEVVPCHIRPKMTCPLAIDVGA